MADSPPSTTKVALENAPELFIGLVGAVGTDLQVVVDVLKEKLHTVTYTAHEIRLSGLISDCHKYRGLKESPRPPEDQRIDTHMDAGDDLRRTTKRGDAIALLAITSIREFRENKSGNPNQALPRYAYIFNSLKHPDEVRTLAKTYGEAFFVVSTYAPREDRIARLCKSIAKSRRKFRIEQFRGKAISLVERDEKESGDELGQNVRDTFPLADVFISESDDIKIQLERFVRLLFGYPYTTPTVVEYGMFHARAAALRSADLSRQVGAVITTNEGEIISAGCNEVPKAKGGAVWEGNVEESKDYRDFRLGQDASDVMEHEIISEIMDALENQGLLSDKAGWKSSDNRTWPDLRDTRISSIIEFGRSVHAEMFAITEAARRGISVKDTTLFCTTFPCHMCARHILASGITQVIFIEPYPKSMAKDLYDRAICVDGDEADTDAVKFNSFVGVAPSRYLSLFQKSKRKDSQGYVLKWDAAGSQPRLSYRLPTYIEVEIVHAEILEARAVEYGLIEAGNSLPSGERVDEEARLARPPNAGS